MKRLCIYALALLCLVGCTSTNSSVCPETVEQDSCIQDEIIKDEAYYQDIMFEYNSQKLVGTWIINEHQTITFNGDGTGTVSDDGSGRLDNKSGIYKMTYEFKSYNKLWLMFSMNFECEIGATAIYNIVFNENELILLDNPENIKLKRDDNPDVIEQVDINETIPTEEMKINEALVGTWIINEHQTITFNGNGFGSISDDGSDRLDKKPVNYDMDYEIRSNKIYLMLWGDFECPITSSIHEIRVTSDEIILTNDNNVEISLKKLN